MGRAVSGRLTFPGDVIHWDPDGSGCRVWFYKLHPSVNEWKKWHGIRLSSETERWRHRMHALARSKPAPASAPLAGPLWVHILWLLPGRVDEHDLDNYTPKMLMDALKGAIITDDKYRVVRRLTWDFGLAPGGRVGAVVDVVPYRPQEGPR